MRRRDVLGLASAAAAASLAPRSAWAQTAWPSANITIVVPFTPGGLTDILARSVGELAAGMDVSRPAPFHPRALTWGGARRCGPDIPSSKLLLVGFSPGSTPRREFHLEVTLDTPFFPSALLDVSFKHSGLLGKVAHFSW